MELYLSFSEIVRFFKRHLWKFAVLVVLCGLLFGFLSLRSFKRQYTATSTILIACTIDDNASPDYSNQYASMLNVRLQAAIALADSEDVRAAVAEYAGAEDASLLDLTAKQVGTSTLIELTVTTTDRFNAAPLADAAAEVIGEEISAIYPTPPIQVHLTAHAEEPAELSARSSAVKGGILGLVFGVILAVCIGLAVLLLDHTIRNASYVEKSLKLPCLGSLAAKAEETGRADEFRRVRAAFTHQVGEKGTVLLTSVGGKHGAALAACGLAKALAAARRSVLLVETDFSSSVQAAETLGVPKAGKGLVSVLKEGGAAREATVSASAGGVSFLASGELTGSSADLLASADFSAFLRKAAAEYDYVLCVLPGEQKLPDADAAAPAADAVILVADYGATPYRSFEESLTRLRTAGGNPAGFILQGVR